MINRNSDDAGELRSEKMFVSVLGYLLLKHGYTAESVSKSLGVKYSFVRKLLEAGIKEHSFPSPSKECAGEYESPEIAASMTEEEFMFARFLIHVDSPQWVKEQYGITEDHIKDFREHMGLFLFSQENNPDVQFDPANWLWPVSGSSTCLLERFVFDRCNVGQEFECEVKTLFSAWTDSKSSSEKSYCSTLQLFGKRLREIIPDLQSRQCREDKKVFRKYIGINLK